MERALTLTSPPSLKLVAPAKINLFLHITGRRSDGYHLLESVFAPVTLADEVILTLRKDGAIRLLNAPAGLSEENDLACRAARALQSASSSSLGVDIELVKQIPQGAGLGGGSSDAATTLLGLNRLWKTGLARDRLLDIGAGLGADVPFFIFGQPALVRGIGEELRAVSLPQLNLVLASPGVGVSTGAVFNHPALTRNTIPLRSPVLPPSFGRNDMQRVAALLEPKIDEVRQAFESLDCAPRMTGSGSCVFALACSASHAQRVQRQMVASGWQCWAVQTLQMHPLHRFAGSVII
jgi:4-diphosphocytidyl-2-C-methyl-D-erythritol kinase